MLSPNEFLAAMQYPITDHEIDDWQKVASIGVRVLRRRGVPDDLVPKLMREAFDEAMTGHVLTLGRVELPRRGESVRIAPDVKGLFALAHLTHDRLANDPETSRQCWSIVEPAMREAIGQPGDDFDIDLGVLPMPPAVAV